MRPSWRAWSPQMVARFCHAWESGVDRGAMIERYGRGYVKTAASMREAGIRLAFRPSSGPAISFANVRGPEHSAADWKNQRQRRHP